MQCGIKCSPIIEILCITFSTSTHAYTDVNKLRYDMDKEKFKTGCQCLHSNYDGIDFSRLPSRQIGPSHAFELQTLIWKICQLFEVMVIMVAFHLYIKKQGHLHYKDSCQNFNFRQFGSHIGFLTAIWVGNTFILLRSRFNVETWGVCILALGRIPDRFFL